MNESVSRSPDNPPRSDSLAPRDISAPGSRQEALEGGNLARLWPRGSFARTRATFAAAVAEFPPVDAPETAGATQPRFGAVRVWLIGVAAVCAIVTAGVALARYISVGRFIYSTDDAYVRTDLAIVSPKIAGYIEKVAVIDNQHVKSGELLARIDAGDYQLAVDAARHKIATQDATIARMKAQTDAQEAIVAQAQAQVDGGRAELARAEADLGRVRSLTASMFASRQRYDQSLADRDKAIAASAGAQAQLAGAKAGLVVLQSQVQEAEHVRAELAIALARAERDLGFTEIKAPFAGILGNRVVEPGQYVQPGARLMALAPDDRYYVDANFKETQLDRLTPGEKVKVRVDAYGGREFDGVVESIAPASGSEFSLLPPENATGNFTKITQRFPVRIRLAATDGHVLRAGMSVVVDVDTRSFGGAKK
jgi:membrane fusion protein, multidrug efflux system